MTKDDIAQGLRICGKKMGCGHCPGKWLLDQLGERRCDELLMLRAADLIEQQTARIKELETEARRYATKDDHATLRRVTRAVNDIATWLRAKIESERRDLAELESYGVPPIYSPVGVISDAKEVLTRLEACLSETGLCDKEKKEENVRNG